MELSKGVRFRLVLMAAAFVAVLWGFQAMLLDHAPHVFNAPEEDMSFAWFVPVFSAYVVFVSWRRLVAAAGSPSVWGLVAALPFLVLGFFGARGLQVRLEIVAFAGLCVCIPWAFWGRRVAHGLLFPAAFLLFCIPLATFLDVVTVHLRLLASSTAYGVLHGLGVEVVRQGTMIGAADGSFAIDVAEPCSGLRSIFALLALTAGYAYFNQPTPLRKWMLFACAVPIAILGNVARILSICLVARGCSSGFATGFYHDYSGYVVFLVAIVLMVAVGEAMTRLFGPGTGVSSAPAPVADGASAGRTVPVFTVILVVAAMVVQAMTPAVTVAEPPAVTFPAIAGYEQTEIGPSEAELTVLPADTLIEKRLYGAADGDWFQVTAVIGGKSKSSIHRPELCLPSQGLRMSSPRTVAVGGVEWRFITLEGPGGVAGGFAYTFVNQDGFRTASHTRRILRDVIDRSVFNRIDRWVMITVNAARADDRTLAAIAAKLEGAVR